MFQFPDIAAFAAALNDHRFAAAVGVALLAGVVRGFSGFGSALIFVPLIAAVYEPRVATVSFVLMDFVCVAPFALRAVRQAHWREVLPAFLAAVLTVPLGTVTQQAVNPVLLRWGIALFVLAFVTLLASGWRYPFKSSMPASIGAGALSGFTGGAAQLGGPPLILYWLGSPTAAAAAVRANLLVYLVMLGLMLIVNYAWNGLTTAQPIALAVLLWPVYIVALIVGARWFHGASEAGYRRVAYVIVALAAFASLPVFDRILH
jgi:uncharacterized membrane protein YfcA